MINTELDEKSMKELEENAESLSLDTSSLIKKLIIDGIKQLRIKKMITLYDAGKLSLGQLAEKLELTIYELLVLLKNERVPIGGDFNQTQQEINGIKVTATVKREKIFKRFDEREYQILPISFEKD